MKSLQDAILSTLAYFDIFEYPLTLDELAAYLIGFSGTAKEIKHGIESTESVESYGGYYFLKGRQAILAEREKRELLAQERWEKVKRYVPFLRFIPGVKMAAVCNTLAFNQATPDSDIDLFIVTAKNRLFTARMLITGFFSLFGARRTQTRIAGRFCLSFFTASDHLNLQPMALQPYDLYLAYWIRSLKPLFGEATHRQFLHENRWIMDYFPYLAMPGNNPQVEKITSSNFLERFLGKYQKDRAQKKAKLLGPESSIIIHDAILKFHNVDRRAFFRERWEHNRAKLPCR